MSDFSCVVFDLDGTLVDSSHDITAALNRVLIPRGGTALSAQRVAPLLGEGVRRLVANALHAAGLPASTTDIDEVAPAYLESYRANPVVETVLYAGVADMLETLHKRGVPLGVCTNKSEAIANQVLAWLGVDRHFDTVVGGDRVPDSKPHPDHLLAAFRDLDQDPAAGVLVGDSTIDQACARAAGVAFRAVAWASAEVTGERLTSFADLVDLVTDTPERTSTEGQEP
jgi:phosphoglycolate phosphatase